QCGTRAVTQCRGKITNDIWGFSFAGTNYVNNIWFNRYYSASSNSANVVISGDNVKLTNCALTVYTIPNSGSSVNTNYCLQSTGGIGGIECHNSYFSGSTGYALNGSDTNGDTFDNCVFRIVAHAQGYTSSGLLYPYAGRYCIFYILGV